jgi:hypothetical protein
MPIDYLNTSLEGYQVGNMPQVLKKFFLLVCILVAAYFANYFGYLSIPWLDIDVFPAYSDAAKTSDQALKQAMDIDKAELSD